jgi:hypothetical protein
VNFLIEVIPPKQFPNYTEFGNEISSASPQENLAMKIGTSAIESWDK